MKKTFVILVLLAAVLFTVVGCTDGRHSDYAGVVDTSGVVLPENAMVGDRVCEEANPVLREAVLRQGRATVSNTFPLTAAVKTSAEVAYKRLIAFSAFCGEPADQDLYIYRFNYKLSENAKAVGMGREEFCRMKFGLSLEEYRDALMVNLRELLVVTAFCEAHGIFYSAADRENLLGGAGTPLYPADEYELQLVWYRERAMRLLEEQGTPVIMNLSNTPVIPFAFHGNMDQGGE